MLNWLRRVGRPMESYKEAADLALRRMPAPDRLFFPTVQHQGRPAIPVVKRRDKVKVGTLLAEADSAFSAPIHSSVSGTVRAIEPILHPWGTWTEAIVVDNDGEYTREDPTEDLPAGVADPTQLDPATIRARVAAAGIVGMGGAMFPTALKLKPANPVDTIIVNGCECEPVLSADHRVLLEQIEKLVYGMRAVQHAVGAERVILAIETNKPDAIRIYRELSRVHGFFEVKEMPARYPYGAERVLIPAATGRTIPYGKYPDAAGVVVQNVATVAAIADALQHGKPLVERAITVSGLAVTAPGNWIVPIGTPIEHVLNTVGLRRQPTELVLGGPMMGIAVSSAEIPVIKGTSGILARAEEEVHTFQASACLHCGRCVDACPANLMPTQLARLSAHGRFDEADKLGVRDCMECGLCSHQCPAELPLTQLIRLAKTEVRKKEAERLERAHASDR